MAVVMAGGEMRALMPEVAAFVDALRAAFGRQHIDRQIALGLRNGTFYATEDGHTLGVKPRMDGVCVVIGGWRGNGAKQREAGVKIK